MTSRPTAFVIMPFDEEFDPVYTDFIKPVMESAGFDVDRADDIESHQSILRDVLHGINKSDLIIADLTSGNPNVFYELGLAHAFGKPVILTTQSIEEVPFDLRSYRLLEYSTHFAEIGKAKEKMTDYARGFLEKNIQFGSPVTDFYPDEVGSHQATDTVPSHSVDEDDRGFLDHLIDINDGYTRIARITKGVTDDMNDLTQSLEAASNEFSRISANSSASSPAAARSVARRLAERIGTFNSQLKQANVEYASIAQDTEDSLEFVVSFQVEQSELENSNVAEQLSSLRDLQSVATSGRNAFLDMASTMDGLPRIERRLNREVARGSEGIRSMASNIDKTIASITRALKAHD